MLRCEWLYGDHLMRNLASATIAPGKSSLVLAEAIVAGRRRTTEILTHHDRMAPVGTRPGHADTRHFDTAPY
jgi:hypothetical protein